MPPEASNEGFALMEGGLKMERAPRYEFMRPEEIDAVLKTSPVALHPLGRIGMAWASQLHRLGRPQSPRNLP